MRAVILSAGQGTRLLPLTKDRPKCLLPVCGDRTVLEEQLSMLAACGVDEAVVVVGFGADKIERFLARQPVAGIRARAHFNPFFDEADNLVSCWLARPWMDRDFLLLNGDTLFEHRVLERLLAAPEAPLTLVINEKETYDDDDMKVSVMGGRLRAVGKTLDPAIVNGESIGLMRFSSSGSQAFADALNHAVRDPGALRRWYLWLIDAMAGGMHIETTSITGLWWGELDFPEDLAEIRAVLEDAEMKRETPVWTRTWAGVASLRPSPSRRPLG